MSCLEFIRRPLALGIQHLLVGFIGEAHTCGIYWRR